MEIALYVLTFIWLKIPSASLLHNYPAYIWSKMQPATQIENKNCDFA